MKTLKKLDVGCGKYKHAGCVGMDRVALIGVDVVHDMNCFPWPFKSDEFSYVRLSHVIEHCDSIVQMMEEVYRVVCNGAIVEVTTPHYTDPISWKDITHKWHLSTKSFEYFEAGNSTNYYSKARFEIVDSYVEISKLFKILGIEFLVNLSRQNKRWRFFRRWWEIYFCFLVRGKSMHFKLKAEK